MGINFVTLGRQEFLRYNTWSINHRRKKYDELDFMKMKNFCSPSNTIKNINMQAMEWEKIFAMHIYDKELNSKIYTESFLQLNKTYNSVLKWAKCLHI